jgi:hypothetical protein
LCGFYITCDVPMYILRWSSRRRKGRYFLSLIYFFV